MDEYEFLTRKEVMTPDSVETFRPNLKRESLISDITSLQDQSNQD